MIAPARYVKDQIREEILTRIRMWQAEIEGLREAATGMRHLEECVIAAQRELENFPLLAIE